MNVLIVGGGAREHALSWKLKQSPRLSRLFAAPGNGGTAAIATNLPVASTDIDALVEAARDHAIDLVVVGPEDALAAGLTDRLNAAGIPVFGPSQAAARIETSKIFATQLMDRHNIPHARGVPFTSLEAAEAYVRKQKAPIVVKADGLAAGKGTIVASSVENAVKALHDIMEQRVFGEAGASVLVQDHMVGREVSLFAFTDGETVTPTVAACDYKRAFDGDEGPNTGGMGSYSPPPFFGWPEIHAATESILKPTVRALAAEGSPYKGVLYAGLMVTEEGPKVFEFNARLGDPETQVLMPRLKSDLLDIILATVSGKLSGVKIAWTEDACVGVALASGGYPGKYETGYPIAGLSLLDEGVVAFHAGTRRRRGASEQLETNGGRVITVAACAPTIAEARAKVYRNVPRIEFEAMHYRKDIAAGI